MTDRHHSWSPAAVAGGVTAPIVTPMDERGRVTPEAASSLVARLAAAGVDALLLAGSTGEGHAIDAGSLAALTATVSAVWRRETAGQGRVFVNVSAPSTAEALHRAETVAVHGPDAIVLSPPYYFIHTQAELIAHYRATSGIGVPVIAYNVPRYTNNPLTREALEELVAMPWMVGMKDSSGDRELLGDASRLAAFSAGRFSVSQGDESSLAAGLRLGAQGIVPGVANLAARRCVELYRAAQAGDWDAAERAQQDLRQVARIHTVRRGVVSMKAALSLLGIVPPHVSAPFLPLTAEEIARLREILEEVRSVLDP
jgi:4-hydroxy-tetrahydrodipicolinate synthase